MVRGSQLRSSPHTWRVRLPSAREGGTTGGRGVDLGQGWRACLCRPAALLKDIRGRQQAASVRAPMPCSVAVLVAALVAALLPLAAPSALGAWLERNGAGSYEAAFVEAGYGTVEDLGSVTEADLKKLGLKMKERKRLSMALHRLSPTSEQEGAQSPPQDKMLDPEVARAVNDGLREAQSLRQAGDAASAVKAMERVIELDPQNPNWRLNLASLYQTGGETQKALHQYGAALDRGASDIPELLAGILPQMGSLLRKAGRADKARVLFDDMLAKYPDLGESNPSVALELSQVLKATGDSEAAAKAKKDAMCVLPSSPVVLLCSCAPVWHHSVAACGSEHSL